MAAADSPHLKVWRDVAETSLAQCEAYKPSTDHDRRMKAQNVAQIREYLARGRHPSVKGS